VGSDIAIATLDPALHPTIVATLTGGATTLVELAAVPPDAFAIAFTASAPTLFGALSLSPPAPVNALALFGIGS
jgi:hypothetical protein